MTEKIHDPRGFPPKVAGQPIAARLDDLDDKVVYLVPIPFANVDPFMRQLQAAWADRFPRTELRILPEPEFGKASDKVRDEIVAQGDGAVIGVGL